MFSTESTHQHIVYPESLHAIVTCKGGIFPIQILRNPDAEGAVTALPLLDIYTQLAHVMSLPAAQATQDPSTVCGLSVLHRRTWHAIRKEILKGGGEAAESLEVIESAILALSLEDCPAPTNLADILNAVHLGGADGQCLRYYDKVVNMVVFKDSIAGMVFEHSALDGMVAGLSRKLITALESCLGPDNVPRYTKELFHHFHLAFLEHKNLIKTTKSGHGVGPHLGVLRRSMSEDNPLKKYLDLFGCPSINLTGSDLMEGTECAVGNVYATNQLAVTYLGKKDKVRLVLNGKGTFASILGKLAKCFELNLKLVMVLAVRYAIAGQMGAIECLLQKEERSINSTTVDTNVVDPKEGMKVKQKGCLDSAPAEKSSFTLVIHGGAGEEMMLSHKVAEVIEFALETALTLGAQVLSHGGSSLDAVQRSVSALEDCFLFNAGKGSVYNRSGEHEMEATIVDGHEKNSGSVACVRCVKNPVKAARHVMEKSVHSLLTGDGAEEFLETLQEREKPMTPEYFHTDVRYKELAVKLSGYETNHPQTVGAVALDCCGKLAAATSTGGLVGKWKGRVGDTAIVGAGIYADKKLAVTCSGDGDAFLRETVAHKVASLYNLKGYTLAQACREVIYEDLGAKCAGIIAVDHKGETAVETNAGVMFVASMVDGVARAEVYRPVMSFANVIWETDELIAHLHPEPWTPGTTILTRKTLNGPNSIFQLPMPDYMAMLLGAQTVANLLSEKLGVHRCALVSMPTAGKPAHIKILPMHGVEPNWKPHLAEDKEFYIHDPGYCSSKSGPRCEDASLDQERSNSGVCGKTMTM
ncbi:uncharacterized protein LOC119263211 [Pygocentrus nattereri]|uniref:uncharacterized protein LOC119263211 n=1 Tax=Pygocentrus nattereri TaxID=42514 RepID=UPI001890E7A5|nr:uncharacterized protein LOC119263211 [Pygocentrus nattereri]